MNIHDSVVEYRHNMKDIESLLSKSGLSTTQARICKSLIMQGGGASASQIAKEAKLARTTVYSALDELELFGIINSFTKNKKKYFQLQKLEMLKRHIKDKYIQKKREFENMTKSLPFLQDILNKYSSNSSIRVFRGESQIKTMYKEHVRCKNYEMLGISNPESFVQRLGSNFLTRYATAKGIANITARALFTDTEFSRTYLDHSYKKVIKKNIPQVKYIKNKAMNFEGEIILFGNQSVSFINLENDELFGVIIEDKQVYTILKQMFELLWSTVDFDNS